VDIFNSSGFEFLREVGHRLSNASGDLRETSFLFQRVYVILQRFNSALIREIFIASDNERDIIHSSICFYHSLVFFVLAIGTFTPEGIKDNNYYHHRHHHK